MLKTGNRNPLLPYSSLGLSGYCFHPWCPNGWVGDGRKSLSGLYLRNCKVQEVDTWLGHWLKGVGVQRHGVTFIKRPLRDACLCMGDLQAPPALLAPAAPHFVFLITL